MHVEREQMECKFWLDPLVLASNDRFSPRELNRIRGIIQENLSRFRKAWHEHCSKS